MNRSEKNRRQFLPTWQQALSPVRWPAWISRMARCPSCRRTMRSISFDLEETARGNIPPAHWGYLATGVNGDSTLRANRTAFREVLCPREATG